MFLKLRDLTASQIGFCAILHQPVWTAGCNIQCLLHSRGVRPFHLQISRGYCCVKEPKCQSTRSIQTDLRPISLLPTVAKVLESFIGSWLQSVLQPTLDDKQYGCRPKRSTTHALTAIIHEWQSILDHGGAVWALLVDFKKSIRLSKSQLVAPKITQQKRTTLSH